MDYIVKGGLWLAFAVVVAIMLIIDLFLVGKKDKPVSFKSAAIWSAVWVTVSGLFAVFIYAYYASLGDAALATQKTTEYVTGYLIEKTLAIDNVFVWLMIFSAFAIPASLQKRVLVYGVLGAIVLRTLFIFTGVWLIEQFHWLLYVFGALLLFTGIKMLYASETPIDPHNHPVVKWLRKRIRMTDTLQDERFFVKLPENKRLVWFATPLFLVLLLVELSDIIFAVDSIPAIFAITNDPFIILSSNIMAILGLRAMYFMLSDMAHRFDKLKYGLSVVLVFVGAKMLLVDVYKVPVLWSLSTIAVLIGGSIVWSLMSSKKTAPH